MRCLVPQRRNAAVRVQVSVRLALSGCKSMQIFLHFVAGAIALGFKRLPNSTAQKLRVSPPFLPKQGLRAKNRDEQERKEFCGGHGARVFEFGASGMGHLRLVQHVSWCLFPFRSRPPLCTPFLQQASDRLAGPLVCAQSRPSAKRDSTPCDRIRRAV